MQSVDVALLHKIAEEFGVRVEVVALPGAFAAPGQPLAYLIPGQSGQADVQNAGLAKAFKIGDDRTFDHDPRFGLIVLSEIASRALSPGINDPGTAIDVIGTLVRLFTRSAEPIEKDLKVKSKYDRVDVLEISLEEMFNEAFRPIERDGAGTIEVVLRLQEAFESLASTSDAKMRAIAQQHARQTLARAEKALEFPDDLELARKAAQFAV